MVDIDNFKHVNDTHGHQQGDLVLREVTAALHRTSRATDVPARYGGEELAVILPDTDLEGGCVAAEAIRRAVSALELPLRGRRHAHRHRERGRRRPHPRRRRLLADRRRGRGPVRRQARGEEPGRARAARPWSLQSGQ